MSDTQKTLEIHNHYIAYKSKKIAALEQELIKYADILCGQHRHDIINFLEELNGNKHES